LEDDIAFTSGEELLDPSDHAGGPLTVAEAISGRMLPRFGLPVQIFSREIAAGDSFVLTGP
jgi:hypothetical protein